LPSFLRRLQFRAHVWLAARLLPVRAKRGRLDDLLRYAGANEAIGTYRGLSVDEIIDAVRETTSRPWRMRGRRCLREGLLAHRFLALAGFRPVLHFGISPATVATDHPRAHCWLELDGETILNPATEPMLDLFAYDGRDPAAVPEVLREYGEKNG